MPSAAGALRQALWQHDSRDFASPYGALKRKALGAFGLGLLALLAFVAATWSVVRRSVGTRSPAGELVQEAVADAPMVCSASEDGLDYIFQGEWLLLVTNVADGARCCELCRDQDACQGWSWVYNTSNVMGGEDHQCWLKGGTLVEKLPKLGIVSGSRTLLGAGATDLAAGAQSPGASAVRGSASERPKAQRRTLKRPLAARPAEERPAAERPADKATTESTTTTKTPTTTETTTATKTPTTTESTTTTKKPTTTETTTTTQKPTTTETRTRTTTKKPAADLSQGAHTAMAMSVNDAKVAATDLVNPCPGPDEKGSCVKSKCCKEPGHQCRAKNDYWAECMVDCVPGPNFFDAGSSEPWSCKPLGERTPGEPKKCPAAGENCIVAQCCSDLGMQCYAKNDTYGTCKAACDLGMDMGDEDDWNPWSCRALGPRSKAPAEWISKKCAHGMENCAQAQCCGETGMQCYLDNQYYGQCKASCTPTQWAKCTPAGPRTPKTASTIRSSKRVVGPWVEGRCAKAWANCADSRCCAEVGAVCYSKDSEYAACRTACNSSALDPEDNKTWECEALGPRSWGLATKGYPSLYCVSLYMPEHYEGPLLRSVLKRNAGIFQCDGYDVFAAVKDTLGTSLDGITVKAVLIPKISVGVSQDGTAGNAKLFMAVWDKVIAGGRHQYYDWTVKVDPDAVLLPWRLRARLEPHVGENAYVVNCNKVPGSPNFPMMFGALEVFSLASMLSYAASSWKCGQQLPWKMWGEDYYMTHCMDFIGVGRISDFGVLGDNMCLGANCADSNIASFHPFKTESDWHACWDTANGHPPTITFKRLQQ